MSDMLKAFNDVMPADTIDVKEIDELVAKLKKIRDIIDELSAQKKEAASIESELEGKIIDMLTRAKKDRWDLAGVGMVYHYDKMEVRFPEKAEARKKLVAFIKDKYGADMVQSLYTIPYASINKFYNTELEKAKEQDPKISHVEIPGLDMPVARKILGFRKNKE